MAKTLTKQQSLPPTRMREVVSCLCMYALHKAGVLDENPGWKPVYPGEENDLRSCAEFAHDEGSLSDETLDVVLRNMMPF